jgi:ABC-type sugar transport system ATPase subunit
MATGLGLCRIARGHGETVALAPVDLTVADGELLTPLGSSQSGRTTLLRLVRGFIAPA